MSIVLPKYNFEVESTGMVTPICSDMSNRKLIKDLMPKGNFYILTFESKSVFFT